MAWALVRWHIGDCAGINLAVSFVALIAASQTDTAYPIGEPSTAPTTSPLSHVSPFPLPLRLSAILNLPRIRQSQGKP
jgi:hypothetical protein